ncbi:MAG: UDP-N-acetylmuramoyl-tripeptide--D-alanyl-D-alanine ligase [Chitinispirillaceae bacterium]
MSCHSNSTPLTIGSLIKWGSAESEASEAMRRRKVKTVWNDSRQVASGDVFVALRTENDDGHRYVQSAFQNGANAAIVDRKGIELIPEKYRKKCIIVTNTLKAVQKMAARYRNEMGILVVGITGSNGKTTTRSFVSTVLKQAIKVGETFSNWNNHIGVPLSLLRFDGDEWAGVIEMGANHIGEIHPLSKIAAPDISVITNIGYAHVGLFGSLKGTTQAKFEIADGLSKDGFMLLNGDDPRLVKEARRRDLRTVFFGTTPKCDFRAENIQVSTEGVSFDIEDQEYVLGVSGRHFVYSVLPAIYIARRCGIPEDLIQKTLVSLSPVSLRGMLKEKMGIRFIVDCYNANPSSMSSAIRYLADITPVRKQRVAIIGDMLELEKYTRKLHLKLGEELVKSDVRKIIAVGEFASHITQGAVNAGLSSRNVFEAVDSEQALQIARDVLKAGETVLLKGSRGIRLEKVFEGFENE